MKRLFLILSAGLVCLGTINPRVSSASGTDNNPSDPKGPASYQWPSSPGLGHGGLYIEDDISHTRLVSTLGTESGSLCGSMTDTSCADQSVQFYAILPRCVGPTSVDCIESISAKSSSGIIEQAQFERYFPEHGLADFTGRPEAKIPSGASSSLWNIPSATHAGGNEYLAVVSLKGSANSRGTLRGPPVIHASLYPVQIVAGKFSRNVPIGTQGVNHPSFDPWGNCASLDEGYCAARQEFPPSTRFSMALRLTSSPIGWLHGRIFDPEISFAKSDSFVQIQIEANPVQVPAVATWTEAALLPKSYRQTCTAYVNCDQINPQSAGAVPEIEDWRALYQDKASWVRGQWFFQTLGNYESDPNFGTCFSNRSLLHGFITTNATGYSAGPPSYSTSEKAFSYTVSSPHFDAESRIIIGAFSFVIRKSTARCLYGIANGEISAKVTISASDRGDISEVSVESVSTDSTWLKVNASGFHYSSPVIKTLLRSATTSTPSVTAKSIAAYANLAVLSTSKISLKVASSSSKYCKVARSTLKVLKIGPCKVTVTVTPIRGRATSKTVTLKIKK